MAKINLSVSDELKQRMKRCTNVNWSKVASEAFNKKIIQSENESLRDAVMTINRIVPNFMISEIRRILRIELVERSDAISK